MVEREHPPSLETLTTEIERFDDKKSIDKPQQSVGIVGSDAAMRMGIEFVLSVMMLGGAGLFFDQWLGTSPLCMVTGLFTGAAAGFWMVIRTSNNPP